MRRRFGISHCLLLLLATGCASPPESPKPQDPPAARGLGEVIVENACTQSVFRIHFAKTHDAEWGPDRLGNEVLKQGATRSWYLPTGTYRVHAQLKDGSLVEGNRTYDVAPGQTAACILEPRDAPDLGTLTVTNDTGFAIAKLMFTLSSEIGWGEDRLKTILPPSANQSWKVKAGRYNLKIVFQDGTSLEGADAYEVVAGQEAIYHLRSP
jgi:hypothetical protein